MGTRAQRTGRILALQEQLHRVERWRLLNLQRRKRELDELRDALIASLNQDEPLQGLLLDTTVRRLTKVTKEATEVAREEALQATRVRESATKVATAERLSEMVDKEEERARDRETLQDVIDGIVGAPTPASRKIAPA